MVQKKFAAITLLVAAAFAPALAAPIGAALAVRESDNNEIFERSIDKFGNALETVGKFMKGQGKPAGQGRASTPATTSEDPTSSSPSSSYDPSSSPYDPSYEGPI